MQLRNLIASALLLTTVSASAQKMALGTNFWDVSWGNGMADPFANGWDKVSGDHPWSQVFIDETGFYTAFRFMDWNKVNDTGFRRWAERRQKLDPAQNPVAYEWMIDICNKMRKDMWVCVPHITDEGYAHNLARLIHEKLDPRLRCWVEYSNETWNDQFDQAKYCQQQGTALGLGSNQWYAGQEYHARASMELFKAFEEVFANARHRLVNVMGGTHVHAFAEVHLRAIKGTANPGVTVDAYALAPYVGNGIAGGASNLYNEMVAAMMDKLPRIAKISAMFRAEGITMVTYEGGQHILNDPMIASRNEQMYDFYRTYLDTMSHYFDLMMHYCAAGASWGAKERHGEPDAIAPKYRALRDYSIAIGQFDPSSGQTVGIAPTRPIAPVHRTPAHPRALFTLDGRVATPRIVPPGTVPQTPGGLVNGATGKVLVVRTR